MQGRASIDFASSRSATGDHVGFGIAPLEAAEIG